jgi:hypothetical protein
VATCGKAVFFSLLFSKSLENGQAENKLGLNIVTKLQILSLDGKLWKGCVLNFYSANNLKNDNKSTSVKARVREKERESERETDRQTDRQTDRERDIERHRETQ